MAYTAVGPRHFSTSFREAMSRYPTGVVVVTATGEGEPMGMVVGTFASVSLDPPLIAFSPSKTSQAWSALQAAGAHFAVNVLSSRQVEICQTVASRTVARLQGVPWYRSAAGNPFIEGATLSIDCTRQHLYDAGDHYIVVARVEPVVVVNDEASPLIFLGGSFGSFAAQQL